MINGNNTKGFTLVEILVSIALLGIMAISMLPLFTNGYRWIINAGNKSKIIYVAQEQVENKIVQGASNTLKEITITFPSVSDPVIQTGEEVIQDSIRLFIPKQ